MSWDAKSERINAKARADLAAAQADIIRADAEAARARVAAELKTVDDDRKRKLKAERRTARNTAIAAHGDKLVPALAIGAPAIIAWKGQYTFAAEVMHLGLLSPLLPIALEGSVLYAAMLTHKAVEAKLPTGRYRALTWTLAAIAAGQNFWHGSAAHQVVTAAGQVVVKHDYQVGVALGLTSLLSIVLLEMTVALRQKKIAGKTAAEIREALVRRLRYPVLSMQASSIAAARGLDREQAWTAAWTDRYGVGPEASRLERQIAKKVVTAQRSGMRKAAKTGGLVLIDGVLTRVDEQPVSTPEVSAPEVSAPQAGERVLMTTVSPDSVLATITDIAIGDIERFLRDEQTGGGALMELPAAPGEHPDSDDQPHGEHPAERPADRPRKARNPRQTPAAAPADGDRLAAVIALLQEDPTLNGNQIHKRLGIPWSTARRLRKQAAEQLGLNKGDDQ